jgi:hypothetical protein
MYGSSLLSTTKHKYHKPPMGIWVYELCGRYWQIKYKRYMYSMGKSYGV